MCRAAAAVAACGKVLGTQTLRGTGLSPRHEAMGCRNAACAVGRWALKRHSRSAQQTGGRLARVPPFLPAPRLTPYCDPTLTTNLPPAAAHLTFTIRSKSCRVGGTGVSLSPGSLPVPLHAAVGACATLLVLLHATIGACAILPVPPRVPAPATGCSSSWAQPRLAEATTALLSLEPYPKGWAALG